MMQKTFLVGSAAMRCVLRQEELGWRAMESGDQGAGKVRNSPFFTLFSFSLHESRNGWDSAAHRYDLPMEEKANLDLAWRDDSSLMAMGGGVVVSTVT